MGDRDLNRFINLMELSEQGKLAIRKLHDIGMLDELAINRLLMRKDFEYHVQKGTPTMQAYEHLSSKYRVCKRQVMRVVNG